MSDQQYLMQKLSSSLYNTLQSIRCSSFCNFRLQNKFLEKKIGDDIEGPLERELYRNGET